MNDFSGILLILGFSGEGECVLGFAVWDLVDSVPSIHHKGWSPE